MNPWSPPASDAAPLSWVPAVRLVVAGWLAGALAFPSALLTGSVAPLAVWVLGTRWVYGWLRG